MLSYKDDVTHNSKNNEPSRFYPISLLTMDANDPVEDYDVDGLDDDDDYDQYDPDNLDDNEPNQGDDDDFDNEPVQDTGNAADEEDDEGRQLDQIFSEGFTAPDSNEDPCKQISVNYSEPLNYISCFHSHTMNYLKQKLRRRVGQHPSVPFKKVK